MSEILKQAAAYLNRVERPTQFKSRFHFDVPIGWLNDPNGSVRAFGQYHVFYQHNPYWPQKRPMFWGHAVTDDLTHWRDLPPALAPDEDYDRDGCWSGTAMEWDGKLYLLYTGVRDGIQQQCLAVSENGVHFTKSPKNPVIPTGLLPPDSKPDDFRDPCLWREDGWFYAIVGGKDTRADCGRALLYRSRDLTEWAYVSDFYRDTSGTSHGIFECPAYLRAGNGEALVTSLNHVDDVGELYRNPHVPVAYLGRGDFAGGSFRSDQREMLDYGFDYYAPQIFRDGDRSLSVAWMQNWSRTYPTGDYGWIGSFTYPREITVQNGALVQRPAREIDRFCRFVGRRTVSDPVSFPYQPARVKMTLGGNGAGFAVTSADGTVRCVYSAARKALILTRDGNVGRRKRDDYEKNDAERVLPLSAPPSLDVLFDNASVEIFADTVCENAVMTSTFFFRNSTLTLTAPATCEFYQIEL